ncbi:MAG: hypothetical protein M1830_006191, partial [Pleopsidium flavum]
MALNIGQSNGKTPDRGHGLYVTALVMVIVAGFFVIGRLAARWMKRKFGMDDYTIVLSLIEAVVHGYGKHKKDLTHEELMAALK